MKENKVVRFTKKIKPFDDIISPFKPLYDVTKYFSGCNLMIDTGDHPSFDQVP